MMIVYNGKLINGPDFWVKLDNQVIIFNGNDWWYYWKCLGLGAPEQNSWQFADVVLKCIFMTEKYSFVVENSLKFGIQTKNNAALA